MEWETENFKVLSSALGNEKFEKLIEMKPGNSKIKLRLISVWDFEKFVEN